MTKMKPEIKQRWVEALRSGDYEQTIRFLRDEKGFCCLGVLCDVFVKANNLEWKEEILDGSNRLVLRLEGTDEKQVLPSHVAEWAGLVNNDGSPMQTVLVGVQGLEGRTFWISLARLNDDGYTFTEISNIIEKYL